MQTAVESARPDQAHRSAVNGSPRSAGRVTYLDNLKVLLVAVIIATHGIVGYSEWDGAWAYEPAAEVRLTQLSQDALGSVVLPASLFAMGLFF